ncbi:MAG: methyl-accepting chemotaxis protein [Desulfuromonadaceae bacterium]
MPKPDTSQRGLGLSIRNRLILGFSATMTLVLILAAFTYWGTAKIESANREVKESLAYSTSIQKQASETTLWINLLNKTRSEHDEDLRMLAQALLQNKTREELESIKPGSALKRILQHQARAQLETDLPELKELFTSLDAQHHKLETTAAEIQETWNARHEGLEKALNDLKRTQIYWALKIANMLFVQSSITALVKEDLEDTPLEQFRNSDIFTRHAPQLDILRTKIDAAAKSNKELWQASHQLNDLMMEGQWEQARILYRDKIPTLVKSISVDIDTVLQIENYILRSQKKAVDVLNNKLAPQAHKAAQTLNGIGSALTTAMETRGALAEESVAAVAQSQRQTAGLIGQIQYVAVILGLVILVSGLCGGWALIRSIVVPLGKSVEMIQQLDAGNLGKRLHMQRSDEIGKMATLLDSFADHLERDILHAFKKLAAGDFTFKARGIISVPLEQANQALSTLVANMRSMGNDLNNEATHLAAASEELSAGSAQQNSELQQISSSMENLTAEISHNLDNTRDTMELSERANGSVKRGYSSIEHMVDAMEEINSAGQNVQKIIAVIDEIAFQTNLLALNAAVEAARAGQHGKGFAVVAEEVRNLASRSARAAAETSELIEGSIKKGRTGLKIAHDTREVLDEIVSEVDQVTSYVGQITTSSNAQSHQVQQINAGLGQIGHITAQTSTAADQSSESAQKLQQQAESLHQMLDSFTLENKSNICGYLQA